MPNAPFLTDAQWGKIEAILPPKRRNRAVISALVFRRWSGSGLRPAAAAFGVTVARLQAWETEFRASGCLIDLMNALGLPQAPPAKFSNGGQRTNWGGDADSAARLLAYRFGRFREALRAGKA